MKLTMTHLVLPDTGNWGRIKTKSLFYMMDFYERRMGGCYACG